MNGTYGIQVNGEWVWYVLVVEEGKDFSWVNDEGKTRHNNYPGHERLIIEGYRKLIPTVYNNETHSLVDTYTILNDTEIQQDTRGMTAEELQIIADAKAVAEELADETAASPLNGITFAQVDTFVENNVTDLTSAKDILKKFGKAILLVNKRFGL